MRATPQPEPFTEAGELTGINYNVAWNRRGGYISNSKVHFLSPLWSYFQDSERRDIRLNLLPARTSIQNKKLLSSISRPCSFSPNHISGSQDQCLCLVIATSCRASPQSLWLPLGQHYPFPTLNSSFWYAPCYIFLYKIQNIICSIAPWFFFT